jgi:hypothetical protein
MYRNHHWEKENVAVYYMWPLKKYYIHMNCLLQDEKIWSFITGDRLILVPTWPGLIVYEILSTLQKVYQNYQIGFLMCKKQTFN